ncbi:MAG: dolichol-phosphate mannosyltransferase, partial [Thermoleophilaceae bacterium]|nr:dolichol-phosphate mannosyltransferase [Thermoleophilaceae bacterium]
MTGAWLILPTYNEAENIEAIVHAARGTLREGDQILIVDDNSPDGTGRIADALAQELGNVEVLHRPGKSGLGRAYLAGFARALEGGAEYLIEMDADFSHDPGDLPRLIAEAEQGADLVLGSRYVEGGGVTDWGLMRRLISRGGSLYARAVLHVDVRDLTGGFKCFRRHVLETLDLKSIHADGYGFQIEMTYRAIRAGFRVVEI